MVNAIRVNRTAGAALSLLLAAVVPALAAEMTLNTDFGPVSLEIDPDGAIYGDYPNYQGELVGKVTAEGGMELTWLQPNSEVRCDEPRHGTYFWGRVAWAFQDGQALGGWAYCDAPVGSSGAWNGQVIAFDDGGLDDLAPEAVSDADMHGMIRYQWGQIGAQSRYDELVADINCDGAPDRIVSRVNLDNPDGPFFEVLAMAYHKGELISDMLTFTMSGDNDLSVCSGPEQPAPMVELWEPLESGEVLDMTGYEGLCATPLRVDDGMCDAHWLFWSDEPITEGHFVTYRN